MNNFTLVTLTDEQLQKAHTHAEERAKIKYQEYHHGKIDGGEEVKRIENGVKGEFAIENLLGKRIVDLTIGDSQKYNKPDIEDCEIGIKSVENGKFPVIFKKNDYPQIICILSKKDPHSVFVCGVAEPDVLNTYQSLDLVVSKKLRERGTKTCFYGFEHLIPVEKYFNK